jgi:hypothetical protein
MALSGVVESEDVMIRTLINSVIGFVRVFQQKPSVMDVLTRVMALIPEWVTKAIRFAGYNNKERFDLFLQGFDDYTGSDEGAIDLIEDLPADKEEEFFDHIKEAGGLSVITN